MSGTIRRGPQPITTVEIDRSSKATARLLSEPADWLRRLLALQLDVRIDAPARVTRPRGTNQALEVEGFERLCAAHVRHRGLMGLLETQVNVWVDVTRTIRAEMVGDGARRTYLSTLFEDGSQLVSLPDEGVAQWLRSRTCEVLCATGNLGEDLEAFRSRARECGRSPLLCLDAATYGLHLRLAALRCSKEPQGSVRLWQERPVYPMTLMVAAQMIAHRDERVAAVGLPA